MSVNDALQWAMLVVLMIFVVGLTRQLAYFIRPSQEQRADGFGPSIGDKLAPGLLDRAEMQQLEALMQGANERAVALMVVNELCEPCELWLDRLARASVVGVPVVALTKNPGSLYLERLGRVVDLVISDDERDRLKAAGLTGSPFLMLVDHELRVQHKQLGGDPSETLGLIASEPGDDTANGSRVQPQGDAEGVPVVHTRGM